jgi:hypothetical protein
MMNKGKISAVMSVPRLAFMDNWMCAQRALWPLGIEVSKATGAFWGQCLTRIVEQVIKDYDPEWIMMIDYDTIFTREDIESLIRLTHAYPDIDAFVPVQMHRTENRPLLTVAPDKDGNVIPQVPVTEFYKDLTRLQTGHMGCALLKAESFKKLSKPWFHSKPDANGSWDEGREDDDTFFWLNWWNAGNTLYSANRVPVGHAELMFKWADRDISTIHQHPTEFWKSGKPAGVWR